MDGFTTSLSPFPQALEDEGNDNGFGDDDDNEDEDASSFNDKEMTISQ